MNEFLLKVKDTFQIKGLGLILDPTLPLSKKLPETVSVVLKRPDKTTVKTKAVFTVPFFHFTDPEQIAKHQPSYTCILKEVDKQSVPTGTEVWLENQS